MGNKYYTILLVLQGFSRALVRGAYRVPFKKIVYSSSLYYFTRSHRKLDGCKHTEWHNKSDGLYSILKAQYLNVPKFKAAVLHWVGGCVMLLGPP